METTLRESATDIAGTSISPRRRRNSSGFRAGWTLLACSAALALSSCSAGEAESAEGGSASSPDSSSSSHSPATPAPTTTATSPTPSPMATLEMADLIEPVPHSAKNDLSAAGRAVLSQRGTGGGTYAVEGHLEPGEVLSLAASCGEGDEVTMTLTPPLRTATFPCDNPSGSSFNNNAAGLVTGDMTVTVETANGGPFWVTAWAHDGSATAP